jgi:hypothetical protein
VQKHTAMEQWEIYKVLQCVLEAKKNIQGGEYNKAIQSLNSCLWMMGIDGLE